MNSTTKIGIIVKVVVGSHPIPKKYFDIHTHLGTLGKSGLEAAHRLDAVRGNYPFTLRLGQNRHRRM